MVVASSVVSGIKAQSLGLTLKAIEQQPGWIFTWTGRIVTSDLTLLKGRGYDLVKEKLLVQACGKFIVLVDPSKLVERIGARYPIPVEVMPFAWQLVKHRLEALGGQGDLRQNASKDGLAITSHGSLVLDMTFPHELDSKALNHALNEISGIVEHGIFYNLASAVFLMQDGKLEKRWALRR